MNQVNLKEKILGSMGWNSISIASKFCSEYFIRIGLAFFLAPDDFGIFAVAVSLISILQVLVNFGFQPSLIRRTRDFYTKDLTQISYAVMLRNAVFVIIGFATISYHSFHLIFESRHVLEAVWFLLPTLLFVPRNVIGTAQLSRQMKFNCISKAEISSHLVFSLLAIILVVNNKGYLALVLAHVFGQLTRYVLLKFYSKQKPALNYAFIKYKSRKMSDEWNLFSHHAFWFFGSNIVAVIRSRTDLLMVGALVSNAAAGIYSMAYALTDSVQMQLASIVNKTMFPVYSSLKNDRLGYERAYFKVSMWVSLLLVPAYTLLYIFSEILVESFFSSQWKELYLYLQLLSISSIVYAFGGYPAELINALGRSDLAFRISFFNYLLVCIPSLIILIGWLGAIGAPIAVIIHYTFLRVSHLIVLNVVFKIRIFDILKPMIPAMIISVLLFLSFSS